VRTCTPAPSPSPQTSPDLPRLRFLALRPVPGVTTGYGEHVRFRLEESRAYGSGSAVSKAVGRTRRRGRYDPWDC
jgi:hypothetical protein